MIGLATSAVSSRTFGGDGLDQRCSTVRSIASIEKRVGERVTMGSDDRTKYIDRFGWRYYYSVTRRTSCSDGVGNDIGRT